jgi:hypothetical protein
MSEESCFVGGTLFIQKNHTFERGYFLVSPLVPVMIHGVDEVDCMSWDPVLPKSWRGSSTSSLNGVIPVQDIGLLLDIRLKIASILVEDPLISRNASFQRSSEASLVVSNWEHWIEVMLDEMEWVTWDYRWAIQAPWAWEKDIILPFAFINEQSRIWTQEKCSYSWWKIRCLNVSKKRHLCFYIHSSTS